MNLSFDVSIDVNYYSGSEYLLFQYKNKVIIKIDSHRMISLSTHIEQKKRKKQKNIDNNI
jgi:hypothetical protein